MATEIKTNENPTAISFEGSQPELVAEVMNSSHLTKPEIQAFHKYLVNHEIRWRHAIPEVDADAILGVWTETYETDWKDKTRMFAKGTLFEETEAQKKAVALLKRWSKEGKQFGVSSQIWKLSDKNDKTVAVLFREASLTPFQRIEDCLVYKIYEDSEVGKPLSAIVKQIIAEHTPPKGVEILQNEDIPGGQPLVININVGGAGQGSDPNSQFTQAIQEVDQALQKLKGVSGVSLMNPAGSPGDNQPIEPAPSPEEFAQMKGKLQPDSSNNMNQQQSNQDQLNQKNSQRQRLNAYEDVNKMEQDNLQAKLTVAQYEVESKAKEISSLQTSVQSFEAKVSEYENRIKELEVSIDIAKDKISTFEADKKALQDNNKALIQQNEGLQAKVVELELFPERWEAARLAGKKSEDEIKQYFNEIQDFSSKQLKTLIAGLKAARPQQPASQPQTQQFEQGNVQTSFNDAIVIGDAGIPQIQEMGKAEWDKYEQLAKEFPNNPEEFLKRAVPDRYF